MPSAFDLLLDGLPPDILCRIIAFYIERNQHSEIIKGLFDTKETQLYVDGNIVNKTLSDLLKYKDDQDIVNGCQSMIQLLVGLKILKCPKYMTTINGYDKLKAILEFSGSEMRVYEWRCTLSETPDYTHFF